MESTVPPLERFSPGAARDDRKSAHLAAQNQEVDPAATLVQSYAFSRQLLRHPLMKQDAGDSFFDPSVPATTPVIMLDGEPHRRKRSAIAKFFSAKAMNTHYAAVTQNATDTLLRSLQRDGHAQLDSISFELAVTVASEIVGLTNSDRAAMARRIASSLASGTKRRRNSVDRAIGGAVVALKSLYFLYCDVRPAIKARRKARREDVISQLLDHGASEQSILIECLVYAAAGMVTTREFIVMAAWHMFEREDIRRCFIEGTEQEQFAILEEILRLEPVAAMVNRRASEDISDTMEGPLRAGANFAIDIRAANADESVVGSCPYALDPRRADISRGPGAGLSFGDGPHRCPGAQVALHEARVFLDSLFRLPGIRLERAPDMLWNKFLRSYELRNAIVTCSRAEAPS